MKKRESVPKAFVDTEIGRIEILLFVLVKEHDDPHCYREEKDLTVFKGFEQSSALKIGEDRFEESGNEIECQLCPTMTRLKEDSKGRKEG